MATVASMPRQPFADLTERRLQQLTSIKNVQNSIIMTPTGEIKSPLSKMIKPSSSPSNLNSNKKRTLEPTSIYEDKSDSENVDPRTLFSPTKKTKTGDFTCTKPSTSSYAVTPVKTILSVKNPSSAPAGLSPPRKNAINRRTSAPYTRINPPTTASKEVSFFSLEECLSASISRSKAASVTASMPESWFFDIYEDTPEQEAQTLMEHSACILDLSSDDEITRLIKSDRGKENVAPEGFIQPIAAGRDAGKKTQRRRKIVRPNQIDNGERTPLTEVEREDFFPEGVKAGDVIIVAAEGQQTAASKKTAKRSSAVAAAIEDIVIFEDAE